jgi:hypothetical protein
MYIPKLLVFVRFFVLALKRIKFKITVFCDMIPCTFILKMEAAYSSKTLVAMYQSTRRHILENYTSILNLVFSWNVIH